MWPIYSCWRQQVDKAPIMIVLEANGYCPICESQARFLADDIWLRDAFKCTKCDSIPRQRALMVALEMFRPNWRAMNIHEASPIWFGTSKKLITEAKSYSYSFYDPAFPSGEIHPKHEWKNENLEALSFKHSIFDIFLTQDVFEHVFHPDQAIAQIARVLKPGGLHVCTIPLSNRTTPSSRRAKIVGYKIEHIMEPIYHGNPIDESGSLVTFNWGFDIGHYLDYFSGLTTTIVYIDDVSRGIKGEAIEVLVMEKPREPVKIL